MTLFAALCLAVLQALALTPAAPSLRHGAGTGVGGVCAATVAGAIDPAGDAVPPTPGADASRHAARGCDAPPVALRDASPVVRGVVRGHAPSGSPSPNRIAALGAHALVDGASTMVAGRRAARLSRSHAVTACGGCLPYFPTAPPRRA